MFSLSSLEPDAQIIGRAIHQHWGIENQVHWTKGCYCCARMQAEFVLGKEPTIFLCCDSLLSMHSHVNKVTGAVQGKRAFLAAMDNNYMLQILAACLPLNDSLLEVGCQ